MNRKDCETTRRTALRTRRRALAPALAAAGVLYALTATASAGPDVTSIRLYPSAIVTADAVRLGDLCELRGFDRDLAQDVGDAVVGDAPRPGGSMLVTIDEIRTAAAASGVNMAAVVVRGAAECAVSRPTHVPSTAEQPGPADADTPPRHTLRDAVRELFQAQVEPFRGRVELQFGRTAEPVLDLAEPEFTFAIRRQTSNLLGLANLEVDVLGPDGVVRTLPVVVNVTIIRPTVVAARAINQGATIAPQDVRLMELSCTRIDPSVLSDVDDVIGRRARRFIPSGDVVPAKDLENVPLVKRGQLVEVVSRVGAVTVRTTATALGDAGPGEVVELRGGRDRKGSLTAVVTSRGLAEVGPAGGLPPQPPLTKGGTEGEYALAEGGER